MASFSDNAAGPSRSANGRSAQSDGLCSRHEELLQALIDNIPIMLCFRRADGRSAAVNREFERLLGWSNDDLAGVDVMEACFPDPVYRRQAERLMWGQDSAWHELVPTGRSGEEVVCRWTGVTLSDGSRIGIGIDMREERHLHGELARKQEVAELRARRLQELALELTEAEERERQRLAKVLHDDLQQLLIGLKFALGVVETTAEPDSATSKSLAYVWELLDGAIEHARSLSHELQVPALQHHGLVTGLERLVQQMRTNHDLEIDLEIAGDVDSSSESVRIFVFRALRELLINVVNHADTNRAALQLSLDGDRIIASVEDWGRGFDPGWNGESALYHATNGGSGEERGTGFGLFSVRERLDLLGGGMEIRAARGEGTRVEFWVPWQARSRPGREAVALAGAANGAGSGEVFALDGDGDGESAARYRVLLVDDHRIVRQGVAGMLEQEPDIHVIGHASNGRVAIEKVARLRPNVVVMDAAMDVMDGIEATRRIKADWPEVRIIALSMHEEDIVVKSMLAAGAETYVHKAGSPELLIEAVRSDR